MLCHFIPFIALLTLTATVMNCKLLLLLQLITASSRRKIKWKVLSQSILIPCVTCSSKQWRISLADWIFSSRITFIILLGLLDKAILPKRTKLCTHNVDLAGDSFATRNVFKSTSGYSFISRQLLLFCIPRISRRAGKSRKSTVHPPRNHRNHHHGRHWLWKGRYFIRGMTPSLWLINSRHYSPSTAPLCAFWGIRFE